MVKKILIIVLSSIAFILVTASIVVFGIMPVTYDVDSSLVHKVENSVRIVENQKYTTLSKDYKNESDEFKIIAFTDLHLDTYKDTGGDITINLMIRNIVAEEPDLIVFGGDIITSALNYQRTVQLCKLLEDLGVYWTMCLGNHEHDNAFSITREKMVKTMAKYEHCLIDTSIKFTKDTTIVWGEGNHVINILNKDGKIAQSLYLLDSGQDMTDDQLEYYKDEVYPIDAKVDYSDGSKEHDYSYDYVKESQIKWYKETVEDINKINGSPVKSTLFCHIPVVEMEKAWMQLTNERYRVFDEYHNKTYTYETDLSKENALLYGQRREIVNSSGHNSGLFTACKEMGTQAMWFGHDHVNDCILNYQGITLGYIKGGGYSVYNTISKKYIKDTSTNEKVSIEDHLIQGYTVINFKQDGSFTFNSVENYSLYPEMDEEIRSTMQKK